MVLGYFKNKTYFRDLYGNRACIIQQNDGAARLLVNSSEGKEILNRLYPNRQAALKAWMNINKLGEK